MTDFDPRTIRLRSHIGTDLIYADCLWPGCGFEMGFTPYHFLSGIIDACAGHACRRNADADSARPGEPQTAETVPVVGRDAKGGSDARTGHLRRFPMSGPVWLLDIDGVINANKPGWGAAPRKVSASGFVIRWAPALIVRIRGIHRTGLIDIRWSSTWCGYPDQLADLERKLGLDLPRAFTDRSMSKTWAELKAEAAVSVLAEGRRLVWTDDDEAGIAPDFYPELAFAKADGRALLIAPRANRGLQPGDLDRIESFIRSPELFPEVAA